MTTPTPAPLTDADLAKLRAYAEPWAETDVDSHIADLVLRLLAEHQALRERADRAEAALRQAQASLAEPGELEARREMRRLLGLSVFVSDVATLDALRQAQAERDAARQDERAAVLRYLAVADTWETRHTKPRLLAREIRRGDHVRPPYTDSPDAEQARETGGEAASEEADRG